MKLANFFFGAATLVTVSFTLSFIHPFGDLRSAAPDEEAILSGSNVPADVRQLLSAKCGDCHSNGTRWPVYSRFAPGSWLVERDVWEGRNHLNLSVWQGIDSERQQELLARIGSEVRGGEMPVAQYLILHPSARLSDAEKQSIYRWTKVERIRLKTVATNGEKVSATN